MVKKLMEKKPKGGVGKEYRGGLFVAAEILKEDLKKNGKKGGSFGGGLGKKLFGKGSEGEKVKALTEVKANTRSLGMVLRSERELLSQNKDLELEIGDLKLVVEERNREVLFFFTNLVGYTHICIFVVWFNDFHFSSSRNGKCCVCEMVVDNVG